MGRPKTCLFTLLNVAKRVHKMTVHVTPLWYALQSKVDLASWADVHLGHCQRRSPTLQDEDVRTDQETHQGTSCDRTIRSVHADISA